VENTFIDEDVKNAENASVNSILNFLEINPAKIIDYFGFSPIV